MIKTLLIIIAAVGIFSFVAQKGQSDFGTLQQAAEAGQSDSMYQLGLRYENGTDVAKNEAQAAVWYRKASEVGHGSSMTALGVLYQDGRGVKKDPIEAYKWLDLGSKHGFKDDRARAAAARDALARSMGSYQISEANRREAQWHTTFEARQK